MLGPAMTEPLCRPCTHSLPLCNMSSVHPFRVHGRMLVLSSCQHVLQLDRRRQYGNAAAVPADARSFDEPL